MNWLLIRGLGRQQAHWANFPNELRNELGGDVLFLDLLGVGTENNLKAPLSIEEYTNNLHTRFLEIKKHNPGKKWTLISVSLGGMIGLDWVARYPEDFAHLVTINTSAGNLSSITERIQPEAISTILKLFFSNNIFTREKAILKLTTNHFEINDNVVNDWVKINERYPLKRKTFLSQIYAASKFKVPKTLPLSPLLLASIGDHLTSHRCTQTLSKHFGVKCYLHPTAGHDLMLDDGKWIIEKIKLLLN